MQRINHTHWHTSVNVTGPETLAGKTVFLSADTECTATLLVDLKTFKIKKARWEVYRGPGGPLSSSIDGLYGVEAYLGSGEDLRRAVISEGGPQALSLISETVRGIIQAETFLFKERGFKDAKSYDDFWNRTYKNSCRYYSNLDRVSVRWDEHISGQERFSRNLYNKFKTVSVSEGAGFYYAEAGLSDSFHELGLSMTMDKESRAVSLAHCRLLRAPDPVCFEAADYARDLIGHKPSPSKKETAKILGGSQGCVHMIDLCHDLSTALATILRW